MGGGAMGGGGRADAFGDLFNAAKGPSPKAAAKKAEPEGWSM